MGSRKRENRQQVNAMLAEIARSITPTTSVDVTEVENQEILIAPVEVSIQKRPRRPPLARFLDSTEKE